MGKYGRSRQATDGNITLRRKDAHCMPDNYGCRHAIICNAYCFSTAAVLTRTCLDACLVITVVYMLQSMFTVIRICYIFFRTYYIYVYIDFVKFIVRT